MRRASVASFLGAVLVIMPLFATSWADKPLSFHLPSGKLTLPRQEAWKWTDSCHSEKSPCYHGVWTKDKQRGEAYFFAAPTSDKSGTGNKIGDFCKGVFDLQSSYLPDVNPPNNRATTAGAPSGRSYAVLKNSAGVGYCLLQEGEDRTYLWKTNDAVITASFKTMGPKSALFFQAVDRLTREIQIHE